MRTQSRAVAAVAVAVAASAGALLALGAPASAATTVPPWEVSGSTDPNEVGAIVFFDAAGNQITGGNLTDSPIAAYAQGTTTVRAGDTKAVLYAYLPKNGQAPGAWSGEQLSSATTYGPVAGAPASISTTLPVATGAAGDTSLSDFIAAFPNTDTSTDGYAGLYQLRLRTNFVGGSLSTAYDSVDVAVTGSTWHVVYPAPTLTATTTTLTAVPSTAQQGASVTLTATVSPAAGGTVQFADGTNAIGAPVAVSGGTASTSTTFSTVGNHALTATFTPSAFSAYGSSSGSLTFAVTHAPATSTTTTLAIVGPTAAYSTDTLTATVSPSAAAGSVGFYDGSSLLGNATVSSGSATLTYNLFAQGAHSLTAVFNPTDPTSYASSTSQVVQFNADPPAGAAPSSSTVKAEVLPGSLTISSPYSASNPLDLGALAPDSTDTYLVASKAFGDATNGPIQITDTRAGDVNWTASLQATDLASGTNLINGEDLGFTNVTEVTVPGNALPGAAGNVSIFDNAAAQGLAPADAGNLGLKGVPHKFASAINGDGSIGFTGLLSLIAPSSTVTGTYISTITFTVG